MIYKQKQIAGPLHGHRWLACEHEREVLRLFVGPVGGVLGRSHHEGRVRSFKARMCQGMDHAHQLRGESFASPHYSDL